MTAQFPLSGPMSVGDLLDRAFRLYRARFGVFLLTATVFLVPLALNSILAREFTLDFFLERFLDMILSFIDRSLFLFPEFIWVELLSAALANLTLIGFATLALTVQCIEARYGRSLRLGESIHLGWRRLLPYIVMTAVTWAALLAVTVVMMILLTVPADHLAKLYSFLTRPSVIYDDFSQGSYSSSHIVPDIALLSGFLLLVIVSVVPFTYLSVRWLAAPAVLIAEGLGPFDSLRRSWQLTQRNTRRVVVYILLYLILALTFLVLISLLEQFLLGLSPYTRRDQTYRISVSIAASLFSIIFFPFKIGTTVLLYYDLRIRKESYDLELRVAEPEEQVSRGVDQDMP